MEPKGFWGTWCTIFALTGVPFAVLMTTIGAAVPQEGIAAGCAFGVLFGLCMAPLMMSVRIHVPVADRNTFLSRMNLSMAELAYHPQSRNDDYVVFEAASAGGLKVGSVSLTPARFFTVFVQLDQGEASIVGPRQTVRKLEQRLAHAA
jgi:hypothetical protein